MNEAGADIGPTVPARFDRGFDGHWRRQVRLGLALTPAQRLRWLERTMEELRPLVGRARFAAPSAAKRPEALDPAPDAPSDEHPR
jgi:hypothetical protein